VFGAVALIGLVGIPMGRSLTFAVSRGVAVVPAGVWLSGDVPWRMLAIVATFWLASLINLVLLAENRLSSPTEDAVTPLRVGLLAQFLLIAGWALTWVADAPLVRLAASRALLAAATVHLAVVSYFAVTEDLAVPRRVLRRMNGASRWRWLATTFGPGGGRAATYVLAQMGATAAAVALLQPPAELLRWVAAACGYICFFTGAPVLLFRAVAPARDTQLRRRVAVLVVVAASLVVPDIIYYALSEQGVLDLTFSVRHLVNPFRTLANWSVVEMHGWVLTPSVIGFIGVISWLRLIQVGTRAVGPAALIDPAQPGRVAEETGRDDVLN
jgi:hypothetical protein